MTLILKWVTFRSGPGSELTHLRSDTFCGVIDFQSDLFSNWSISEQPINQEIWQFNCCCKCLKTLNDDIFWTFWIWRAILISRIKISAGKDTKYGWYQCTGSYLSSLPLRKNSVRKCIVGFGTVGKYLTNKKAQRKLLTLSDSENVHMNGKSTNRKKPEEHQRDQRFKWPKVIKFYYMIGYFKISKHNLTTSRSPPYWFLPWISAFLFQ